MNRGDAGWLFHKFGLTPPGEQRAMPDDGPSIEFSDVGRKVVAQIEAAYAERAAALRRLFGIGDDQ